MGSLMTTREALAQENPGALLYRESFDAALVGMTFGFGPKDHTGPVAVYDHDKLAEILATQFAVNSGCDGEDCDECCPLSQAEEWIAYNMAGAYLGPNAPMIVKVMEEG